MHDDAADGEGSHGPNGGAVNVSCCVVTPAALATCAEVASALPGHQATNDPSATVACTLLPSDRTSVTPVTPADDLPLHERVRLPAAGGQVCLRGLADRARAVAA